MGFIFELWQLFTEMAPYLLVGFLIAGVLSILVRPESVQRHLGGKGLWSIVKASLFGVPLPLCSCGVIPVSASLRKHGAGRGAFIAFLISTPQTGVDSIMVTLSLLGPVFAVFRPLLAFLSGIIGGVICSSGADEKDSREEPEKCQESCCMVTQEGRLKRILRYGFVTLPRDIGSSLLIGLVLAALISALVPDDFFQGRLGSGLPGMLMMLVIGIPVYVCATASIPVAAVLVAKGVSPGAALVFLMTGPATNAANLATIYRLTSGKTLVRYLAAVAGSALAAGLFFDYVFGLRMDVQALATMEMTPGIIGNVSGVILLLVLIYSVFGGKYTRGREHQDDQEVAHDHDHAPPTEIQLKITGMTCSHCAETVRKALLETRGVSSADVDLEAGQARVSGSRLETSDLIRTIGELGYAANVLQHTSPQGDK